MQSAWHSFWKTARAPEMEGYFREVPLQQREGGGQRP